jgi:tetratricopeptide (TPR) repeat protein
MLQLLVYAIEDNDYSEVIRLCDNAMMYVPELLELYYYKGISTYLMGDKAVSIDVYRQGLANRGEEATDALVSTVYSLLGDTYHEFGMLEESKLAYDSALVYNPENINVLNNYAYYLALEGVELEKALEMSRKTIVAEPDNGIYLDTYAWLLFLLERYEEAKAYAEKLISLPDDMSSVEFHHCGDIFAKCGDIDRAVEFWQKAADAGDDSRILKKKIRKRKYYRNANK